MPPAASGERKPDGVRPCAFRRFDASRCEICRRALTVHEQAIGRICSQNSCKQRALRTAAQQQLEERAALRAKALACRDQVARQQAIESPDQLGLAILPSNDRPLTNTPDKTIREFRDGLMQKIGRAAERRYSHWQPPPVDNERTASREIDQREMAVLGNACATCRGNCCPQGARHAFIHVETISGYMQVHPERRPAEVLQDYMDQIPSRSFQASCVYHTQGGCALPRQMRSHICNDYMCAGLGEVLQQLDGRPAAPIFVVATSAGGVTRAAIIDEHQSKMYDTIEHALG